jgi:hypothetical protein
MIGLIKYSRSYFTANEKARCNLWFSRTKGTSSPSMFNLITLITYLLFFLLFVCLACPWSRLYVRTLALTTLPARVLAYQHTWFCLFSFHFTSYQSFYFVPKFFFTSPPLGLVSHFSLLSFFDYPFHLPDLLQPACFPCLLTLFVCDLCLYRNLNCLCQLKLVWVGLMGCVL